MRVKLSDIDKGAADLHLCRAFVYALPEACGPPGDALIESLRGATERVVRRWRLLQGLPVFDNEVS